VNVEKDGCKSQKNRDQDFLGEMKILRELINYIALKMALEDLLGCSVDASETENLHPYIREQVLLQTLPL